MSTALEKLRSASGAMARRKVTMTLPDGSTITGWATPLSLVDRRRYNERFSRDGMEAASWLVCDKLEDGDGNKLFEPEQYLEVARLPGISSALLQAAGDILSDPTVADMEKN